MSKGRDTASTLSRWWQWDHSCWDHNDLFVLQMQHLSQWTQTNRYQKQTPNCLASTMILQSPQIFVSQNDCHYKSPHCDVTREQIATFYYRQLELYSPFRLYRPPQSFINIVRLFIQGGAGVYHHDDRRLRLQTSHQHKWHLCVEGKDFTKWETASVCSQHGECRVHKNSSDQMLFTDA